MATYNGQDNAIVQLDDTAGSLLDISDYVKDVKTDIETKIGRFSVLGKRFDPTTEGTAMVKGTMTVYGSVDAAGAHHIINHWLLNSIVNKAGLKSLRVQTPDAAVGSFQYDMEIRPGSYNLIVAAAGEANPGEHALALEVDGAPTWTVIT